MVPLLLLPAAADMSGTSLLTRTNRHRRRVSARPWPLNSSLLSFSYVVMCAVGIEFTAADDTATSFCCSYSSTIPTECDRLGVELGMVFSSKGFKSFAIGCHLAVTSKS